MALPSKPSGSRIVAVLLLVALGGALMLSCVKIAGAHPPKVGTVSHQYATAKKIIYSVFPASKAAYAMRIAGCETGMTYSRWATGSAGERGYFQIHPGNAGRALYDPRTGKRVGSIEFKKLYQPWYNTWVAYYMSNGGTRWSEWTCSRLVS